MADLSLSARVAGLQTPILQIESLAMASITLLEEMTPFTDPVQRDAANHVTNLISIITDVARRTYDDALGIERDATVGEREANA